MTPRQRQALDFIESYIAQHRYSPNFEEIRKHLGLASKSGVSRMVDGLVERGHLRRTQYGRNRNLVPATPDLGRVPTAELLAELDRRRPETAHD